MVKTLQPIREKDDDFFKIERQIELIWDEYLYKPLLQELGSQKFKNSYQDLLRAIQDGQITFNRGRFKGNFSSGTSKELRKMGAKWDSKTRSFAYPSSKLNIDLKNAISVAEYKFIQVTARLEKKLAALDPAKIASHLHVQKFIDATIWKTNQTLEQQLKSISVQPKLSKESLDAIGRTYNENMQRYIQKWTEEEIVTLRAKIAENVYSGRRYEGIMKELMESHGQSKNKAKFLARQETSLYMASFRRERYGEAGIKEYIWKNTGGHEVRHDHKLLNGTRQRYDRPPVTNQKTGARNNPGEDFGCLCLDFPVVEF